MERREFIVRHWNDLRRVGGAELRAGVQRDVVRRVLMQLGVVEAGEQAKGDAERSEGVSPGHVVAAILAAQKPPVPLLMWKADVGAPEAEAAPFELEFVVALCDAALDLLRRAQAEERDGLLAELMLGGEVDDTVVALRRTLGSLEQMAHYSSLMSELRGAALANMSSWPRPARRQPASVPNQK